MKNLKIIIPIFFIALALIIAWLYFLKRKDSQQPRQVVPAGQALFKAEPRDIEVEVAEGGTAKTEFSLKNIGTGKAFINLYKTEEASKNFDSQIDEWLIEKQRVREEEISETNLKQFADFSGAPWLLFSPYYLTLNPQESRKIELTLDARGLTQGSHKTNLIIVGKHKEEILILPVSMVVSSAPQVKVSKIKVDDGFSEETMGNQNKVVNSSEKALISIELVNQGGSTAENISAGFSSDDPAVKVKETKNSTIESLKPGEIQAVQFLVEAQDLAWPDFPPAAEIIIKDDQGKEQKESFYLGEEGFFQYPTGMLEEEDNLSQ